MAVDRGDHVRLVGAVAAGGQRQAGESQPESGTTRWGGWSRAGYSRRNFGHSVSFEGRGGDTSHRPGGARVPAQKAYRISQVRVATGRRADIQPSIMQ